MVQATVGPSRLGRREEGGGDRDSIAAKPVSRAGRARPISRSRFEFHRKERILFLLLAACAFLLSAPARGGEARGLERTEGRPTFPREVRARVFSLAAAFIRAFQRLHAPPAWIFDGTASKTLYPRPRRSFPAVFSSANSTISLDGYLRDGRISESDSRWPECVNDTLLKSHARQVLRWPRWEGRRVLEYSGSHTFRACAR